MYGFPADLDLSGLIGNNLNPLLLSRFDVQLCIDGAGIVIAIQGNLNVLEKNVIISSWNEDTNWSSLGFQKLLNAKITGYRVITSDLLEIQFENDLTLHIHDDSDQYETTQIYFEDSSKPTIII